jgi:hypothetical protein
VLTRSRRFCVDTKPRSEAVLTYPAAPNPATVEMSFSVVTSPEINPKEVDKEEIAA